MIELQGKYNTAKVFTDTPDEKTIGQIIELCNQEFAKDSKIRIMPDCHFGAGCTIGTTMTIQDKIVPNLVGVDVGCGMSVSIIKVQDINFEQLDDVIRKHVPSGQGVHDRNKRHSLNRKVDFRNIIAPINMNRAKDSIGTLAGGIQFIEINENDDETIALVIHSGSRSLGAQIAKFYQDTAYDYLTNNNAEKQMLIERLKREGREQEIQTELSKIKTPKINRDLAYLTGKNYDNYLNDMRIAQHYAILNRQAMADIILQQMGWGWLVVDGFDTIHNYIDLDTMILRKGAISAQKGERVIVPINMRDGSIIATGKGNPDWNYSGPHGAGRVLSRSQAREHVDYNKFEATMSDVWSTSVKQSTVDESPMAYKTLDHILNNVTESLDVQQVIKPLYNFKA